MRDQAAAVHLGEDAVELEAVFQLVEASRDFLRRTDDDFLGQRLLISDGLESCGAGTAALARHPSGPMAAKNCIAAVEAAVGSDYATGVKREWALFQELAASPYAHALQYAFFAERKAADIPDIGPDVKSRVR